MEINIGKNLNTLAYFLPYLIIKNFSFHLLTMRVQESSNAKISLSHIKSILQSLHIGTTGKTLHIHQVLLDAIDEHIECISISPTWTKILHFWWRCAWFNSVNNRESAKLDICMDGILHITIIVLQTICLLGRNLLSMLCLQNFNMWFKNHKDTAGTNMDDFYSCNTRESKTE